MLTRSIGGILRGRSTPLQLMLACVLGAMLGFAPGFSTAGGWIVTLSLLLLVLNANLALAALVLLGARLLAWLLLPVTFAAGRLLLDGPTQGLFKSMINAPVLALLGFEYYLTSGGILMGLLVGLLAGLVVVKLVGSVRRRLAALEENSEGYRTWANKGWVKMLLWLVAGKGQGKLTYAQILQKRVGNPIRWWGAGLAALMVVGLLVGRALLSEALLTGYLKKGLEQANGATVDVGQAQLNLKEGRLTVTDLAMADPEQLDTDLLRAAKLQAAISTADLLRKRVQIDSIVISDATHGTKRATPGKRIGAPPPPLPPKDTGGKSIEDYLKDAQKLKERLKQVRDWLEKLSGTGQAPKEKPRPETLKERLDRLIRQEGYARVQAAHLVEGAPTVLVVQLLAQKVRAEQFPGETLDIEGEYLSTQPHLVAKPPRLTIKSSKGTLDTGIELNGVAASGGENRLRFAYSGLPVEKISGKLAVGEGSPLSGGTLDVRTEGTFSGGYVRLPLQFTLLNSQLSLGKGNAARIERLVVPVGVRGPLDNPRLDVDPKALQQALVDAGAKSLVQNVKSQATQRIGKELEGKLPKEAGGLLDNLIQPTTRPRKR